MSCLSELGNYYENLNTDDIGLIQHLYICNMVLPFDFEYGSQVTKLNSCEGFDVPSVENGTCFSIQ